MSKNATTSLTIERYRELLSRLQTDIVERALAERDLARADSADDDMDRRKLERALQGLTVTLRENRAQCDENRIAARQALEDRHRARVAGIRGEYCREAADIGRRVSAALEQAREKYVEDCWLLSSIFDDESEASPKWQFENLQSQMAKAKDRLATEWRQIRDLSVLALTLADGCRMRVAFEPEPTIPAQNADDALRRFTAAKEVVSDRFDRLSRQFIPKIFEGRNPFVGGTLLWGLLFTLLLVTVDPGLIGLVNLPGAEWLLIVGGAAFGLSCIVLMIVYSIAGHRTARLLEPLEQASADAGAYFEQWSKFAKDELLQRDLECRTRQEAIVERRGKSLGQFEAARDARTAEVENERQRALRDAAQRRDKALRIANEEHQSRLQPLDAAHRDECDQLQARFDLERERLTSAHEELRAQKVQHRNELLSRAERAWVSQLKRIGTASSGFKQESRRLFPNWEQLSADDWRPPEYIPPAIRLGDYELDLRSIADAVPQDARIVPADTTYHLPCVLPFPAAPSLLLKADGAGRGEAVSVLQTAMLRLLTGLPPGDVRFTIVDPVGLGENFAHFMHLADYDDILISGRIWTESSQIEEQLAKLTEHMENVFQKYLRNEFESIEEYNERAGEVAEPYRILVVANFPANFSERSAQRLVSIATSGARCGVYTLVSVDTRQPMPRGFNLADLEAAGTVLEWNDGHFVNRLIGPTGLPLRIDAPPAAPLAAALIRKSGELSKNVRRVQVPFQRIAPARDDCWSADSRAFVEVPLGRAGATKLQHLRLGVGTSQHVLVAGKTGSGKSTLLNVIVTDLALRYSPDEIEFYLIDFKKGVEFKTYASHPLPHARVVSIESDREFGTSVLERLDAVLKERGSLFRDAAVQDIKAFRDARPDVRMPRILLIVDEFQEFFVEDDRYSQTAGLLLDRLVRQGRAFGIHVILGSQSIGGAYSLARTTIGQMAVRIALQCSDADAHLILSEENSAARLLTRPGEAIYNDANGLVQGNSPFQVAWLDDNERDAYLAEIRDLAVERGMHWPEPIVFEGNAPADPARNRALCEQIESMADVVLDETTSEMPARIWVGDAVAITGPTMVEFPRRSGSNLLVVGQDQNAAVGMFAASLAALSTQRPGMLSGSDAGIECVYLLTGKDGANKADRWSSIVAAMPRPPVIAGPSEAGDVLEKIAAEVSRRHEHRTQGPSMFLLIDDLGRFRSLRKAEDDFGFRASERDERATPGKLLADVLRDGPEVGVHAIVWCDSYNVVDRWFSRQSLREFDRRIALQMSANDSSSLIDSPAASRLGAHRALLYSDEQGTTEKFRPYGPPSDEWLDRLQLIARRKPNPERIEMEEIGQCFVT